MIADILLAEHINRLTDKRDFATRMARNQALRNDHPLTSGAVRVFHSIAC